LVGGLGDLLGALLMPFGTFFFGFTLSWALAGLIYGEFLYHGKKSNKSDMRLLINIIISSIIVLTTITLFLNTYWIYVMFDRAFWVVAGTRVTFSAIMLPIQIAVMFGIFKYIRKPVERFLISDDEDTQDVVE